MEIFELDGLRYFVRYPKHFSELKRYPALFFFHGAGTRGNDMGVLEKNSFFTLYGGYEDLPFVVIAPLCSENTWFDLWERLLRLVRETVSLPYIDKNRVYAIGSSMGGYATWQLGMSMPEVFAAIVPICGGGMYWNAGRLQSVPVWAFHGALDTVVLPEESEKMVAKVNKSGGSAKLTVYPENKHDAWNDTYRNPEVFRWLLAHSKAGTDFADSFEYNDSITYG